MSAGEDNPERPVWEVVCKPKDGNYLERISVPGGWLYRSTTGNGAHWEVAMVFVPEPSR